MQNISTLPEGFTGSNTAATVAVDSAGRFVYASNRGDNSVAVFAISDHDGTLKLGAACGLWRQELPAISPSIPAINGCWWPTRTRRISSSSPAMGDLDILTPTGNQYPLSFPVCLLFR
jgi:6-phosphogluconolactonase